MGVPDGSRQLELSDFLGPRRRAELQRLGRLFLLFAVLFGVAFVGAALWWVRAELNGDGLSIREWLLELPCGVLIASIIAFVLYVIYRVYRRQATARMWLDGSRLIIVDVYGRSEVDLVGWICHVKLSGSTRIHYYPTLKAYGDPEDVLGTQIDLCEPQTGSLRPPQDLLALAAVLQSSPREENQAAAGRLRTLATWKSLPTIYRADPDAIPVTPLDGPPAGPTRVRAAEPSPEVAMTPRPPIRAGRRAIVDVLLAMAVWAFITSSLTVGTVTNGDQAFERTLREGVARTAECSRYGPVSRSGFGYWYQCLAEVTWDDGTRQFVSTRGSDLTPDDIGLQRRVRETAGGRHHDNELYRVDDPPQGWGAVVLSLLMLVALGCLIRPAGDLFRLARWLTERRRQRQRRRQRRAGSGLHLGVG